MQHDHWFSAQSYSTLSAKLRTIPFMFLLTTLLTVLMTGCVHQIPAIRSYNEVGTLQVAAAVPLSHSTSSLGAKMTLSFQTSSQSTPTGPLQYEVIIDPESTTYTETIKDVPVGNWKVEIWMYGENGNATHYGEAVAHVRSNQTTAVQLPVSPNGGTLEVQVDIEMILKEYEVGTVRLALPTGHVTTLQPLEEYPHIYTGKRDMPPGDHDFTIEIFRTGTARSNIVYEHPGNTVRINPGETVFVQWEPSLGIATVDYYLTEMPNPPGIITIEDWTDDETIVFSWLPSLSDDVVGYNVYLKTGELDNYRSIGETSDTSWELPLGSLGSHPEVSQVVVTAINSHGHESFRSEPLILNVAENGP